MIIRLIVAFVITISSALPSFAEDTGWITGKEWWIKSDELDKKHMLLTRLECKDSGSPGLTLKSGLVRVHYERNTKNKRWWWYGTSNPKSAMKEMEKKGFHLVSKDSFVRKNSGLRLYCLLFHK